MSGPRMSRAENHARVKALRDGGLSQRAIAERTGLSRSYVADLLADPDGAGVRARKATYGGTCVDCGAATSGSEGRKPEPRCVACGVEIMRCKLTVWTREVLLDRIHEWATIYGEPPAKADWAAWQSRRYGDEWRARRFEGDDHWPSSDTVIARFGSWNAAMEEAGFAPRAPHGGGGNESRRRSWRGERWHIAAVRRVEP